MRRFRKTESKSSRDRVSITFVSMVVGVMLFLVPASALAEPASLVSVTGQPGENHPTSAWCLPSTVRSEFLQVATSDEVGVDGYFLQKNVKTFNVVGPKDTTFTDEFEFEPGRYYVHVGTHDSRATGHPEIPLIEFSNVLAFDVVGGPNIVGTAGACPVPGGGGGGGGGGGVTDKVAPITSLRFPRVQDVDKLYVKVHTSETATIKATGTVRVGNASKVYRFKTSTLTLPGNASTKVRLKLAKKKLKAVKRALRGKRRLKAKITITATDAAGNRRTKKATLRIKN
jgi:hypothetical protein